MQARRVRSVAAAFSFAFAGVLASGLVVPAAFSEDEAPPAERAALERVLDALAAQPPRTVGEYRGAVRELGLVGESALPHLKALVRRYVDGPGRGDREAHAFLGDRHFHHRIPEDVVFHGHPFIEAVEAGNAREWFRPEDEAPWTAAEDALRELRLHHRRLLEDHRYRAGDTAFANAACDHRHAGLTLDFTWADPYAVVQVGGALPPEALQTRIETLRRTYRSFLAEYGERLDLRDLTAPWGGRPEYRAGIRSFVDGVPLSVYLYGDRQILNDVNLGPGSVPPGAARECAALLSHDGTLHVADPEGLSESATAQILYWFSRQRRRWKRPWVGRDALIDGFTAWFAARLAGPEAERARLAAMQARAVAFAESERPYPVFSVQELITLVSDEEIVRYVQGRKSVSAASAVELYRDQSWALARMLNEQGDGRYREQFLRYLDAWLRGNAQGGRRQEAVGLRSDRDWEALNGAWHRYLSDEILGPVGVAPPTGRRLLVELMRYGHGDEEGTLVRLSVPDAQRSSRALRAITVELPFEAQPAERFRSLYRALDAYAPMRGGTRRATTLRHKPQKSRNAPREDERLVLLALLAAGYEDVTLEDSISPEVRALLEAWKAGGARAAR